MNYGQTTELILRTLEEQGPMTRAELCAALGYGHDYVSAVLTRLNRNHKTVSKRIHIASYAYDADGKRRYPRAVYAIGNAPDKRKPKPNKLEIRRRYEAKKRSWMIGSSVFTLGLTRQQATERVRGLLSGGLDG